MREPKIAPAVRSAIFRLPVATRRSIAAHLDSSHVTVSKALQYLESSGEIVPTDTIVPNGSGRPSDVFSLRADAFHGVGIHFEPGFARVVLLNAAKEEVDRWTLPLPARYRKESEVRATLREVSAQAVEKSCRIVPADTIRSVSFSLPGFVDTAKGIWRGGLHYGNIQDLDIRQILSGVADVRFDAEDTSRSLTQFQLMIGHETQTARHFLVINLGVGLGAGIVMGGEVFLGNGGIVGEIGHIPFKNNSYRCACGNLGCAETMLSATGIRNVFAERLGQGVRSVLNERSELETPPTIEEIFIAAEREDHFARSTLVELGAMLGELIDIVMKCYTSGPIVLAGGGSLLAPYLIPSMEQTLATRLLPEMLPNHAVIVQEYDGYNEAIGTGLLGLRRALADGGAPDDSRTTGLK